MSTYTPGPWNANNIKDDPNDLACAVWAADGHTPICTTSFSVGRYNEVGPRTRHANARLIAAAPQLLAALKALLCEPMAERTVDAAKRAIRAAEGKD
jgi:hypothetical protein